MKMSFGKKLIYDKGFRVKNFFIVIFWKFNFMWSYTKIYILNSFVPNAPFLYPLKISEKSTVFCFQGVEKGCIGNKRVKNMGKNEKYWDGYD